MKKILILDIDGVVNCKTSAAFKDSMFAIDPYMAFLVGKIVLDTGCEVILSSSWKHSKEGIDEVEKRVCKILGTTPDSENGFRGDEINMWLAQRTDIGRFAILDDDSDFYPEQIPYLFKTTWDKGITPEIAGEITKYLNS